MNNLKILHSILLILILTSVNFSQQDSSNLKPFNSLKKGSISIQFNIGYSFTLSSFDGLSISSKYHFSDKIALRIGIGAEILNGDSKYYKPEFMDTVDYTDSHEQYVFMGNVIYYFDPKSHVNFYLGAGPRFSYSYYNDEHPDDYYTIDYMRSESWSIGVNLIAGIEWFPVHYFGFFREYMAYGEFGKSKTNRGVNYGNVNISKYYQEDKSLRFSGNIARLGISAYF